MADLTPNYSSPMMGGGMPAAPKSKAWCLLIPLLIVAWIGWSLVNFVCGDQFYHDDIRGHYVTSTYIPSGANQGKIFLVSDDTFYYFYTSSSPGRTSSGTASLLNRIYYGFYNPQQKGKMENRQKMSLAQMPPSMESFWMNNKIWLVGAGGSDRAGTVMEINPDTLQVESGLSDLEKNIPEFKQGILDISLPTDANEDFNLGVKLMDGSYSNYFPELNKSFKNYSDYLTWLAENQTEQMMKNSQRVYLTSDNPPKLARMSGPAVLIKSALRSAGTPSQDYFLTQTLSKKTGQELKEDLIKTESPLLNDSFVEGIILYQDDQYALILHQQNAKDLSPKLLSLIDVPAGKIISTITEDQMLPGMRVNPNDDFSSMFFIKSDLSASRSGDYLFYKQRGVGVIALNAKTGKIDWNINSDKL